MIALLIMAYALLIPPVIGVADNGDFYRAANGMGIYKLDRFQDDQFLNYASTKFGIYEYYNEYENSLISSQRIFIRAALILDRIFTGEDQLFDIRFLGALYIVYACISIYLLLNYITYERSVKEGWLLSAICIFIFADTGYTAYFNSFFTEGVVYVSFLAAMSCALLITQKRHSFPFLFSFFIINSVVMVSAKQQNATAALALFLICLIITGFIPKSRRGERLLALAGGGIMIICGVFVYTVIPQSYMNINQYHAMTRGVMMEAENPEEALAFFGINPQYSILNETDYFERYPSVDADDQILEDGFYNRYDFVSICIYYISHPDTLLRMLTDAAQEAYIINPDMLGNYDRSEGKPPGAKTDFFTGYSTFKRNAAPTTVGFVIIWILLVAALNRKNKEKLMILLCMILVGLIQIGVSLVEAGNTALSKEVFLYNVAFDLATYISMSSIFVSVSHMIAGIAGGALKGKSRCGKKKNAGKQAV